jgi:hypothetical protein
MKSNSIDGALNLVPHQSRQPPVSLVHYMLHLHVNIVAHFVDKGFKAGEAFVEAGVETA